MSYTSELRTNISLAYSEFRNQVEHRILGILTGRIYHPEISFQYKISRRKTVKVRGVLPQVRHDPSKGAGTKDFYLHLEVSKIGSHRYRRRQRMRFQLSRVRNFPLDCGELILGRFKKMKGG